ncbi:glycosyltransferase [Shewanella frigidimarina]|uniref:glycosyltransferase n=1 Tax=Shewanella frigidimarina TaxID=56812 RepID=UPI000F4FB601|nr:glycosyltransferase [Shewanella frigidimarina]RPA38333.1 glycosyltransferase [Shewanella frigidimarina]
MHSYLIVIFNESVFDTPTYKTLIKMLSVHPHAATLFVWDNSPITQHESGLKSEINDLKIIYYHSERNENLSIVYNKVMKIAFDLKSDYITLLDQDSYISPDFKQSVSHVNSDYLQVPRVCSDKTGKLISPRYQKYNYLLNKCSINYLNSNIAPGIFKSKHMFAVGSGMTISKSLWLSGIRFQDRLSFYGVDTEFCVDYATKSDSFILLDSTIKHNASNEHDESYEKFKWRLIKYYEHWSYQLIKHVGLPLGLVSLYVGISLKFVLLKNKIKRLFIINKA